VISGQKQREYSEERRRLHLAFPQEGTLSLKGVPEAKRRNRGKPNQIEIVQSGSTRMRTYERRYKEHHQGEGTCDERFRVGYPHGCCSRDLPAIRT